MISEKGEKSAFKEETEVADCEVGCQQLTVKSGVACFSGGEFVGERGERLPRTSGSLLQHSPHM